MKRFLSFILSLIMLLSLVPAAAFADTGDVPAQEQTEAAAEPEVTEVPEVTAEPENTAVPEATVSPATHLRAPPPRRNRQCCPPKVTA